MKGFVDIPLPAFVYGAPSPRLHTGMHGREGGCGGGGYGSKRPCFLRHSPYLDNLVLRRAEEERTRCCLLNRRLLTLHKEILSKQLE